MTRFSPVSGTTSANGGDWPRFQQRFAKRGVTLPRATLDHIASAPTSACASLNATPAPTWVFSPDEAPIAAIGLSTATAGRQLDFREGG